MAKTSSRPGRGRGNHLTTEGESTPVQSYGPTSLIIMEGVSLVGMPPAGHSGQYPVAAEGERDPAVPTGSLAEMVVVGKPPDFCGSRHLPEVGESACTPLQGNSLSSQIAESN